MKKCFKCKIEKNLEDFYKHSKMVGGYLGKCKLCTREDSKKNYHVKIVDAEFAQSERDRNRKRAQLIGKITKANPKANERYFLKYPEKKKAALKSERLEKPFDNAEKHHWSYNEEHYKDVLWLVKKEHKKAHRFIVYDQERMMYRRYDTHELLDVKEKHEEFIKDCIKNKED